MARTTDDILRENGYTDEQIEKLDPKLKTAFATVLNEAEKLETSATARVSEAQDIERRYNHMYHTEIVPALNTWGSEKATLTAERDFYKAQNEGARTAGFIPKDAPVNPNPNPNPPPAGPARDLNGRYVAGGNAVPGSPGVVDYVKVASEADWARARYQQVYGEPLPEDYDFHTTVKEAAGLPFREFFSRKYKLAEKQKENDEKRQKEHDEAIRKDERAKADKEYAERAGGNPNLRPAMSSSYSRVRKAVDTGKAKDPLLLNADARRQQTNQMIHADIAERESQGNA